MTSATCVFILSPMFKTVVCLLIAFYGSNGKRNEEKHEMETFDGAVFCLQQSRLIRWEREGEVVVVEALPGSAVLLQCSYCGQEPAREPRIWVRRNIVSAEYAQVKLGGLLLETKRRSLVIRNVSSAHSALYLCRLPYEDSLQSSFNYLLDTLEVNDSSTPWKGDLSVWLNYSLEYINPTNQFLTELPFAVEKTETSIKFEILSGWSAWSECEVCVSSPKQRRTAHCRVRPRLVHYSTNSTPEELGGPGKAAVMVLLETGAALPCRGSLLQNLFSSIADIVSEVPDVVQEAGCASSCPLKGGYRGPRERRLLVLEEGGHAVVPCHGSFSLGGVRWEHNRRRLEMVELGGMVAVDHFGSLHLVAVTPISRGNYTCFALSNNFRILELRLEVRSSGKVLGAGFGRHAFYLVIITHLSFFTFLIITVGLCWRKKRRTRIKIQRDILRQPLLSNEEDDEEESE